MKERLTWSPLEKLQSFTGLEKKDQLLTGDCSTRGGSRFVHHSLLRSDFRGNQEPAVAPTPIRVVTGKGESRTLKGEAMSPLSHHSSHLLVPCYATLVSSSCRILRLQLLHRHRQLPSPSPSPSPSPVPQQRRRSSVKDQDAGGSRLGGG